MNNNEIKNLIKNSNKLVGLKQVYKNLSNDKIKCVIVSLDSEDSIYNMVLERANLYNIPVYRNLESQEIGKLCKIEVSCAVVGVLSL